MAARRGSSSRFARQEPTSMALLAECPAGMIKMFARHQHRHVTTVRDGVMGARRIGGLSKNLAKKLGNLDLVYKTLRHLTMPFCTDLLHDLDRELGMLAAAPLASPACPTTRPGSCQASSSTCAAASTMPSAPSRSSSVPSPSATLGPIAPPTTSTASSVSGCSSTASSRVAPVPSRVVPCGSPLMAILGDVQSVAALAFQMGFGAPVVTSACPASSPTVCPSASSSPAAPASSKGNGDNLGQSSFEGEAAPSNNAGDDAICNGVHSPCVFPSSAPVGSYQCLRGCGALRRVPAEAAEAGTCDLCCADCHSSEVHACSECGLWMCDQCFDRLREEVCESDGSPDDGWESDGTSASGAALSSDFRGPSP